MNLKQKLSKKMKKTGGFTLIEMLIVVAIIAILVVVSIPMVSSSLDKAKKATDDANFRAAKAAAMIQFMTSEKTTETTYSYNSDGTAVEGTQTAGDPGYDYGQSEANKKGYVQVVITKDGIVDKDKTKWVKA
ncbi:type II secretion system protein [Intestinibacillus sp. Marseille-P6563]|uniref:type II secretion system protein n=1 Tax=Intestinibacillus sp. Marseille-P6563 TaxID=2364792 RepID=UPI000F06E7D1|nr:type II secretion system protein [Intestinibacillus sp. Marseille-P6563]